MKIALLLLSMLLLSMAPAWGGCVPVETDRILAKDLAAVRAEFAALDPAIEVGFSPLPGVTRVMQPAEVISLARKYGIASDGHLESVCFVRAASSSSSAPSGASAVAPHKTVPAMPDVLRGEHVSVVVTSGAALLRFQADAESSGRRGDNVLVRNPENGKLFQARVEGKGKVTVQR